MEQHVIDKETGTTKALMDGRSQNTDGGVDPDEDVFVITDAGKEALREELEQARADLEQYKAENTRFFVPGEVIKKETNPKDAIGCTKLAMSVVPQQVIAEIALALTEGATKYGRHNYRVAGVRASIYFDATMRHLMAWWEGQDIDPNSGLHHVIKALASLTVLRDAMLQGKLAQDDRPPRALNAECWVGEMNQVSKALIERVPSPVPPYTQKDGAK